MPFLNVQQKRTLAAICDTLAPALEPEAGEDAQLFRFSAQASNLADELEQALERATDTASQAQLRQFLSLIELGVVNGLAAGQWGAFSQLELEGRTAALRAWANSPLLLGRSAFQGLKRLALFLLYTTMPDGERNPAWPAINYPGPPGPQTTAPRPIRPLAITQPTALACDVLVIGSGAGGGVMAGELSAAGLDVIVVEKGEYFAECDMHGGELEATGRMFEKYGALTTVDTSMLVLAGSTLGGGTTVNWMTSLRPPEYVLREWERDYGFSGAAGEAYQRSLDAVTQRINVNTDESFPNGPNAALERGCAALGYSISVIPRNARGCEECSFCNFGCTFRAKQSTLVTYLQDAHDRGARIVVQAQVDRVTHQGGQATGAELTVRNNGAAYPVSVRARVVVAAAGAIHTPALLLRSGLSNPNIGAHLHLHPVTASFAAYDEPARVWKGVPQSRLCDQFSNLDGRGYGVKLETAPSHPGISALALPWQSGRSHRRLMQQYDHLTNIIIITRDYHSGRVRLSKRGQPVLHYTVHPYDARHLMRGLLESLRIHRAAGAREVFSAHNRHLSYKTSSQTDFEEYLRQVQAQGLRGNAYALFSAHQMSSCRVGGSSAQGALTPTGETYEVKNLFVADGSVFPTATGVNPMVSIMGTAHYFAQQIKSKVD